MRVSSITASSISLSWSVASGRVASWEVVWRPTDRGTESTSGSLPGNTYTIHHLNSSTIYTVTVTATNVAGTTDSTPILFSTGGNKDFTIPCMIINSLLNSPATDDCWTQSSSSETDNTVAITGGVVVFMITTALTILGIVVLVLRSRRGNYSTSTTKKRLFKRYIFTHVIVLLFTEVQLVLQINHWSSQSSQRPQRQLMRKFLQVRHTVQFPLPLI